VKEESLLIKILIFIKEWEHPSPEGRLKSRKQLRRVSSVETVFRFPLATWKRSTCLVEVMILKSKRFSLLSLRDLVGRDQKISVSLVSSGRIQ
jgi:hypothetical protein